MAECGYVKVELEHESFEGILMPSEKNFVVLKLDNGYNIGIDKGKIKNITILKKRKQAEEKRKQVKKGNLPRITILHTGGTIASKVNYETGGVTARYSAEDMLELFPEVSGIVNIESELVSNIMSEDMFFQDYQKIARAVKKHAEKGVKGIIIGHGTDTLCFTASALAFVFEKITVPVILVGSQRSSDRGSTDAAMNLICATEFIAKTDFTGVAICMHNSSQDDRCAILPPTKTRKMHTSRRDAFKAVNDTQIALVDYKSRRIDFLKHYRKADKELVMKDRFENNVGLLKTHPNMKPELWQFYTKNYKGFVIEGTGLGHAPTNLGINLKSYEAIKRFIREGGIVAVTSQCLYGSVHPTVYRNLRRLSEIGCVFCHDMLPETAFIKLAWLLGNYPKQTKDLLTKNLRGEISQRLAYKEDFEQ